MAEGEVTASLQPPTQLLPNYGGCVDVDGLPSLEGEVAGNETAVRPTREVVEEVRPHDHDILTEEGDDVTDRNIIADELREKLEQSILRYKRPLNVLLIGQAGVGKTSFINSVICATIKRRGYWLNIGSGDRANVTSVLRRVNIVVPDEENQCFLEAPQQEDPAGRRQMLQTKAPRFFDVSGLPDENSDVMRMLLRLLLYGHIPVDTNLLDVHAAGVQEGAAALLNTFPRCQQHLIIDRVVVVCAANMNIPTDLTEAVMEAFQPLSYRHQSDGLISKRAVPVFGLLTKQDLIQPAERGIIEEYKRRKNTLLDKLTLRGQEVKLGECQNYRYGADDVEESVNDADIDVSVLRFMTVVCDTTHHITNPDFRLKAPARWEKTAMLMVSLLFLLLIGVCTAPQVAAYMGVLGVLGWISLTYLLLP